jgi:hypothetical protein
MPCNPPKCWMNVRRRESPAGTGGRGCVKSLSSRAHDGGAAGGGEETRGTGVAPAASLVGSGERSDWPRWALRNRPNAVSARSWSGASLPVVERRDAAWKSSRRTVGRAPEDSPADRRRLPSTIPRVVVAARNHGTLTIPSGPSPGNPRVLSNRLSEPTRSGTAWGPRSYGRSPPFSGRYSPGGENALRAPRES